MMNLNIKHLIQYNETITGTRAKGLMMSLFILLCITTVSSPILGQRIAGMGINADNVVYTWYANGKYTVGTPSELGAASTYTNFSMPSGYAATDIRSMAIAPNNRVYTWFKNGMVCVGSPDNLSAYEAPSEYTKPVRGNANFSVVLQSSGASKLNVIKTIKSITGLGLSDCKDLAENTPSIIKSDIVRAQANSLKSRLEAAGATASVQRGNQPPTAGNQPTKFSVVLNSHGVSKLNVIKIIRSVTGLGLTECKALAEDTPSVIKSDLVIAEANSIKSRLEAAGASASVRAGSPPSSSNPSPPSNPSGRFSVVLNSHGASKLNVIKIIKSVTGLGLTECKALAEDTPSVIKSDLVIADANSIKSRLEAAGASASVRAGSPPSSSNPSPPSNPSGRFSVVLESYGTSKLNVIKTIKSITGLGLTECKALAEDTPSVIKSDLSMTQANSAKSRLEAAGATVVVRAE